MDSVSPHEVQQISGSVTRCSGDMIVDKISGIVIGITEQ